MSEEQKEHKGYVTVHTLVDDWPAGTVITHKQAEEAKAHVARQTLDDERIAAQREQSRFSRVLDNAPRLLKLGAIRPATDAEVQAGKAEAPREGAALVRSLDQADRELADVRAENDRLRTEYQRRSGETLEGQPVPASDTSDEVRRLREEAERLRQENEILKARQQSPPTPPPEEVPTAEPAEEEEMGFRRRSKR